MEFNSDQDTSLRRQLGSRQIGLIALGAAIGVGLFYGSASTIKIAGPAILLAYGGCGVFVFLVMRALGEMAIHNPVAGSFCRYAYDYIGPRTSFLTGWTYWFMWVVQIMAEVTAVAVYMHFWFPDVQPWIWALSALATMSLLNLIEVRLFAEFEAWFAAIKVVTILVLIAVGAGMIVLGLGNGGVAIGISNLWRHGGFAPHGFSGILAALPMVTFAYLGTEMIGLTAGEAKDPSKALAKAVNAVFWRIMIFYIGALFIVMSLYPWDQIGTQGSPFVLTFERLGIREAAGIMNFVVLSAAMSSCNSGIFSTGRMLFNLAEQGQAPFILARTSRTGMPVYAIACGFFVALIGVLLNYFGVKNVFVWLTAIATFAGIFTWVVILVSHLRFRLQVAVAVDKRLMPWAPYSTYAALAFLACVIAIMLFSADTRVAAIIGPIWIAGLCAAYSMMSRRRSTDYDSVCKLKEGDTRV